MCIYKVGRVHNRIFPSHKGVCFQNGDQWRLILLWKLQYQIEKVSQSPNEGLARMNAS